MTQKRNEKQEISCHKMTLDCVNKTEIDLRESLLSNILISGGNSLLPGFIERYEKCLYQIAPQVAFADQTARIKVFSSPKAIERQFASWIGGSILGSSACFQNMWISRREFEEVGTAIVKRKCGSF